eukprot:scaffold26851_cov46-Phaeocystis_antarctica.AAC.2
MLDQRDRLVSVGAARAAHLRPGLRGLWCRLWVAACAVPTQAAFWHLAAFFLRRLLAAAPLHRTA